MISNIDMVKMCAVGLNGVLAGAYVFGSFVSNRTYMQLVGLRDGQTLKQLMPLEWPNGRDLMGSLFALCLIANGSAAYLSGNYSWLWPVGIIFSLLPYTLLLMTENIKGLLGSNKKTDEENNEILFEHVRSFVNKHNPRTVISLIALVVSFFILASDLKK